MAYDNPANPNPYGQIRKQAVDAAQSSGQQGLDAITRRYAAMGNLNSGAYAHELQDNSRNTQAATENAVGNINLAERQEDVGVGEAQKGRDLQSQLQSQQLAQQQGQFTSGQTQQESQFSRQLPLQSRALDLQASQQEIDKHTNDISAELGRQQLRQSGGLFGGGGFLGLGF